MPSFVSENLFDFSLPVPAPGGLQGMLVLPYQRSFATFEEMLLPLYQFCSYDLAPDLWKRESLGYTLSEGGKDHAKGAKNVHTGVQA